MSLDNGLVIAIGSAVVVWLLLRWLSPRPDFEPLSTSPDDPLMIDALSRAKESKAQFLELVRAYKENALVKLRFVSSSDQVEHLWAEVLEVFSNQELGVRLITPPVTHDGELERLYRCSMDDVEDWQIRDGFGKLFGGFTQRAMFAIARRDGIRLPKKLLALEQEYKEA